MVLGRQELEVVRVLGMEDLLKVEEVIQEENTKDVGNNLECEFEQEEGSELETITEGIFSNINITLLGGHERKEEYEEEESVHALFEEKTCPQCGTKTTELTLHIAEVHLEEELEEEVILAFPEGGDTCVKCGKTINSENRRREHIICQHPWTKLAEEMDVIYNYDDEISDEDISESEAENDDISLANFLNETVDISNKTNKVKEAADLEEKTCHQCGTATTELTLHIAEVHLEEELEEEVRKVFAEGVETCQKCGKTFKSEYERREHISLQHPWDRLADIVKEVYGGEEVDATNKRDDKILDGDSSNYGAKYGKFLDDKADYINYILNETKTVVGKILDIKSISLPNFKMSQMSKKNFYQEAQDSKRPMVIKGLDYSCSLCDKKWKSSQNEILSQIKRHLCVEHFQTELDAGVEANFKDKTCTLCGTSLGEKGAMRKHLINVHKYFDDLISKDLYKLLTKPQEKPRMKRKRDCSTTPEFFLKAKVSRKNSSIHNIVDIDEDRLTHKDFSAIQSMIEFSDSEDEESI